MAVAVDSSATWSATNVYVAGRGGLIGRFTADGEPAPFPALEGGDISVPGSTPLLAGIAVDSSGTASAGDVYAADFGDGVVDKFDSQGQPQPSNPWITGLSAPTGVAVDAAGDVYVAQREAGNVLEFSSSGEPLHEGKPIVEGLSDPKGLAVDSHGDLYVANEGEPLGAVEFPSNGSGGFLAPKTIVSGAAEGVAVDSVTGDVYVANGNVEEYDPSGKPVGVLLKRSSGPLSSTSYVAVAEDRWTTDVYGAINGFNGVYPFTTELLGIYKPSEPPETRPLIEAEGAKVAGSTEAMLEAQIGPSELPTDYRFSYSTSSSLQGAAYAPPELTRALGGAVCVWVAGLTPNTTYYYRIQAVNPTGPTEGPIRSFTTSALPPQATTGPATSVGQEAATLTGKLDPMNASTTYWFQYGPSAAYGAGAPAGNAGSGTSEVPESVGVSGLVPATTYHFRLVASNAGGTAYGVDQTFTTAPAPEGGSTSTGTTGTGKVAPPGGTNTQPPKKTLTNAQKLAKALQACKQKPRKRRAICARQAHRKYSAKIDRKSSKSTKKGRR